MLKFKNVNLAQRVTVRGAALVVSFCMLITMSSVLFAFRIIEKSEQQGYVLIGNEVYFLEKMQDMIEARPIEAEGHVERYHELFFNLDPDEDQIRSNIEKALYLIDGSGDAQYKVMVENGYYRDIVAGGIVQRIIIDKIDIEATQQGYRFRMEARETITRPTSETIRSLITTGQLYPLKKSKNNRQGFMIKNWVIEENEDISFRHRYGS